LGKTDPFESGASKSPWDDGIKDHGDAKAPPAKD